MAGSDREGFELPPVRIGGPGPAGRRPRLGGRLGIAAVIVVALAIPVAAIAGPRLDGRPAIDLSAIVPTNRPSTPRPPTTAPPTARPTPTPTPLPSLVLDDGPRPQQPIVLDANGLHRLDPDSGELGPRVAVHLDRDALFRASTGDGYWCVCLVRVTGASSEDVTVEVRHFDSALAETDRFPIASYASRTPSGGPDFGVRIDLARSPDGRVAFLAAAERDGDAWTVSLAAIDLERGTVLDRKIVTEFGSPIPSEPPPSPGPVAETYVGGPMVRLSPDGRSLLLALMVESFEPITSVSMAEATAWRIDVDPGREARIGAMHPFAEDAASRLVECGGFAWLSDTELLTECWGSPVAGDASFAARVLDRTGKETAGASFALAAESYFELPIIDRANRLVYVWEPIAHVLHRVDLAGGESASLALDPEPRTQGADRSPPIRPPVWAPMTSDFTPYADTRLVAAPGGNRLYLLGLVDGGADSREWRTDASGVWVVDAASLELLDHWPAAAAYASIGLSADGRWLAGMGQSGVDAQGIAAGWQSSLTIHDTSDGRIALQLGQLGEWPVRVLP